MLKRAGRAALSAGVKQLARLPLTRSALHRISVLSRGAGVLFLRQRRLVPNTPHGLAHADRAKGAALLAEELGQVLERLQKTTSFVSMPEALSLLQQGERLKSDVCCLTFDESFALTAQLALPIVQALNVPTTFFVSTAHLDTASPGVDGGLPQHQGHALWDEAVRAAVEAAAPTPLRVPWIDRVLKTQNAKARAVSTQRLLLSLASLDEVRLNKRLMELFKRTHGRPPLVAIDRMLSADELVALAQQPQVAFGAHGHAHLAFASASDAALHDELYTPRTRLRALCGDRFVNVVSYPFGRPPYIDQRVFLAAREAGYVAGFTAQTGIARPSDHLFRLPRTAMASPAATARAFAVTGPLSAIDEIVMAASGERERLDAALEG